MLHALVAADRFRAATHIRSSIDALGPLIDRLASDLLEGQRLLRDSQELLRYVDLLRLAATIYAVVLRGNNRPVLLMVLFCDRVDQLVDGLLLLYLVRLTIKLWLLDATLGCLRRHNLNVTDLGYVRRLAARGNIGWSAEV